MPRDGRTSKQGNSSAGTPTRVCTCVGESYISAADEKNDMLTVRRNSRKLSLPSPRCAMEQRKFELSKMRSSGLPATPNHGSGASQCCTDCPGDCASLIYYDLECCDNRRVSC